MSGTVRRTLAWAGCLVGLGGAITSCGGPSPSSGITIAVVEGPAPLEPLAGAAVRAESATGEVLELVTDAAGLVQLPQAGAPWGVTVAMATHSAVSLLEIEASPSVPIRLESLAPDAFAFDTYPVSGTLGGTTQAGNPVRIDCTDFATLLNVSVGPWMSEYFVSAATEGTPLHCVAVETDARTGDAVNVAEASSPRTRAAITGLDLTFPATPPPVETTTYHVMLPSTGNAAGCNDVYFTAVEQLSGPSEQQYVLVGSGNAVRTTRGFDYTIRAFGPTAAPNFAWLTLGCPGGVVNLGLREFGGERTVTVGEVASIEARGASLSALTVTSTATGYDYLVVHLGESATDIPRWRVITPFVDGSATARVPTLPRGITLEMIGFVGTTTTALGIVVEEGTLPVYGAPASNGGLLQNHVAVGGQYTTITTDGR